MTRKKKIEQILKEVEEDTLDEKSVNSEESASPNHQKGGLVK
jgi:hypothetical protein